MVNVRVVVNVRGVRDARGVGVREGPTHGF